MVGYFSIDWDGNEIQYDENGNAITVQKKQTDKSVFTEKLYRKLYRKTETTHSNSYGKSGYNNRNFQLDGL